MDISVFNSLPKKGEPHISSEKITVIDFLNLVKYGKWKNQVEAIRVEPDKAKRDRMKLALPAVTISGTYVERHQDKLIDHSGFICIDIDNYTNKNELIEDPYTFSLFKSASGGGLAVIVKVNKEKHKESFRWLREYYYKSFGIVIDPAPQNHASIRFTSYDPELTINEKSKVSKTMVDKPKKQHSLPIIVPENVVEEMIHECYNLGHNIAPDYDSYYKLAFAIADRFGERGREWFFLLCSVSEKFDSRHAEKQYNIAMKGNRQGITIGSLYWMLKQVGIYSPEDGGKAVQVATIAKRAGRDAESVKDQLHKINGLDVESANKLVDEVFKRDDIQLKSSINDPEQLIGALVEWMNENHSMRTNEITKRIEYKTSGKTNEIKKEQINTIYLQARSFFNTKDVTKDLIESFIFSDLITQYNPITEYIESNLHRKSTGNISTLIKTIRSETPMRDIFIRKWMISLIAAYHGNPVRSVLALTGGQNTGKTQWFRRLLPQKLKKYYAESKLDAGKDDEILMCQKLIVMDDEMGGKSKQDDKRFKDLTSKEVFSLRAPYGSHNEDYYRLAVLCGTSNDQEIVNDPTGNTRTLPVDVISIDHELYNSIDKDELFMEAYRAYESGEEWELNKEEMAGLKDLSSDFEATAFERELILEFFSVPIPGKPSEWLTATQIKDILETNTKQKILGFKKFGVELRNIFGKSKSKKVNGVPLYRYEVVRFGKATTSQLSDNQTHIF